MEHISCAFNTLFSLTFNFAARNVPFEDTMKKSFLLLVALLTAPSLLRALLAPRAQRGLVALNRDQI